MVWTDMEAVDPDGRVFEPRYLRTMYSAWSLHSADRLFGGAAIELRAIVPRLAGEVGDARFHSGVIFSQMIMGNHVHTSTVLLRRERVKAVGYFNTGFRYSGEDYDFHLRTCHQGPVGFLDVATIRYQRGMPDRLTRPEFRVHVAGNFLATILPWIRDRRQEIRLPAPMIRSVLGEAYAWLGEAQLDAGDHKGARRNLASGLRYGMHSRTALLLGASVLPPAWVAWLRAALRHVRPRPAR